LFYKSNQSERHCQKSNLTQSAEPAATSTNPFLQDAVYDSTGAAQSGEVDKFLYHFYLTVFLSLYMILDRMASIMDADTLKHRVAIQLLALDTRLLQGLLGY